MEVSFFFFSEEKQRESGSRGTEGSWLGGVDREDVLVRMYCVTEESIFNFKTDYNFKYAMKAKGFISCTYKLVT